ERDRSADRAPLAQGLHVSPRAANDIASRDGHPCRRRWDPAMMVTQGPASGKPWSRGGGMASRSRSAVACQAATFTMIFAGDALAHVKWFAPYDLSISPRPIGEVISPDFIYMFLLS